MRNGVPRRFLFGRRLRLREAVVARIMQRGKKLIQGIRDEKTALCGAGARYPEGKEAITGHAAEPYHIRYVGQEAAREIAERGVTLEEYLGTA